MTYHFKEKNMEHTYIQIEDFKQAKAILKDLSLIENFDKSNPNHIKALKLYEARKENIDFDIELSKRICGDNDNYPYRSSYYLTKFFQELGFNYEHDGTTRRFWVEKVLKELSIEELIVIIEKGLFRKRDFNNLSFRSADKKDINTDEFLKLALSDFRKFIDISISSNESVSIIDILNLNINLDLLFEKAASTSDEQLNKLVEEAKSRFLNPKDKHIALEKLWDAFERIKTYFDSGRQKSKSAKKLVDIVSSNFDRDLFEQEFRTLTKIGNEFRIRHHETDKIEIVEDKHLNYLFFRMLSLIDICLTSIKKETT